jgi:hypothetical protein
VNPHLKNTGEQSIVVGKKTQNNSEGVYVINFGSKKESNERRIAKTQGIAIENLPCAAFLEERVWIGKPKWFDKYFQKYL